MGQTGRIRALGGEGRPHRRGDLARSRVRGASQVVLLHEPIAHGQNHRGDRRGAAGAEPPAQTGPGRQSATPVAARPSPQASNAFLHNGQRSGPIVRRGAVARNGRNAARASGRDRPFQLRIRAGDSACVLTWRVCGVAMLYAASRRVRGNLNNFLRYSWAVALLEREAIRYLACCLSVGIYRFESRPVGRLPESTHVQQANICDEALKGLKVRLH